MGPNATQASTFNNRATAYSTMNGRTNGVAPTNAVTQLGASVNIPTGGLGYQQNNGARAFQYVSSKKDTGPGARSIGDVSIDQIKPIGNMDKSY